MRIAVLFGGTSEERDVSIASAAQIIPALRALGHEVHAVDTATGRLQPPEEQRLLASRVATAPPSSTAIEQVRARAINLSPANFDIRTTDVVFLALHGGAGEDGRIQALLDLASSQTLTFAPLRGERDHEYQFGVSIPFRGWVLEEDSFQTRATNWLDHNNIGESNIFWPITWTAALIQGWETTLRSPRIWRRAQVHLAYSNQIAQATAPIANAIASPFNVPAG